VFCGRHLLAAKLRRANIDAACKIADNSDPLRGIFAFNSDPF
jgi:hypothetical protein